MLPVKGADSIQCLVQCKAFPTTRSPVEIISLDATLGTAVPGEVLLPLPQPACHPLIWWAFGGTSPHRLCTRIY
jgi:hypothetical protein